MFCPKRTPHCTDPATCSELRRVTEQVYLLLMQWKLDYDYEKILTCVSIKIQISAEVLVSS